MKYILVLGLIFAFNMSVFSQNDNPNYDKELAEKLGADEYGMKQYFFVLLKTGNNDTTNQEFINKCFEGHMSNIWKLEEEGKLIIAGPFFKNDKDYRGLYIFDVKNKEELEKVLLSDPAIEADLLSAEITPWYGSAALKEYLEFSDKIWKKKP